MICQMLFTRSPGPSREITKPGKQEQDLRRSNSQTQSALFCVEAAISCRSDGDGCILGWIRIIQC